MLKESHISAVLDISDPKLASTDIIVPACAAPSTSWTPELFKKYIGHKN